MEPFSIAALVIAAAGGGSVIWSSMTAAACTVTATGAFAAAGVAALSAAVSVGAGFFSTGSAAAAAASAAWATVCAVVASALNVGLIAYMFLWGFDGPTGHAPDVRLERELYALKDLQTQREQLPDADHVPYDAAMIEKINDLEEKINKQREHVEMWAEIDAEFPRPAWMNTKLFKEGGWNVAAVGGSGKGKSSICNRLLGVKDRSSKAAKTDGNWECTTGEEIIDDEAQVPRPEYFEWNVEAHLKQGAEKLDGKAYVPTDGKSLKIWDLPGYNTEKQIPGKEYIKKYGLLHYDFVFLILGNRWELADKQMLQTLMCNNNPFACITTLADNVVEKGMSNRLEDRPEDEQSDEEEDQSNWDRQKLDPNHEKCKALDKTASEAIADAKGARLEKLKEGFDMSLESDKLFYLCGLDRRSRIKNYKSPFYEFHEALLTMLVHVAKARGGDPDEIAKRFEAVVDKLKEDSNESPALLTDDCA